MSDEGRKSYYEGLMMKAEDHIMNEKNRRWMMNDERSYYEGWEMMKTEDHIMNDDEEGKSYMWMINAED